MINRSTTTIIAVAMLFILIMADLMYGGSFINPFLTTDNQLLILSKLRIPRILCAASAGFALALAGLQMQSIFRNPLCDPHIMGISSGASLAAALVTMALPLGTISIMGSVSVAMAAFVGSCLVSMLIMAVSARVRNANTLLLFGVLLGYVLSAVISILEYDSSDRALKSFYIWSAGSFASASLPQVLLLMAMSLAGLVLLLANTRGLDLLLFGDDFAVSTGADIKKIRTRAMLSCCILTACVTALCGPLGFVGIISPHIARRIWNSSVHRKITIATGLTGAIVAVLADILSMVFKSPLPVGSTMAIVGIPVVMYILFKSQGHRI